MKTQRKLLVIFFFFCLFPFVACDSPLSDIEITDPTLITPHFYLERTANQSGSDSEARAYLSDKNFNDIKLKNGRVMLNNDPMSFSDLLNKYSINEEIWPNSIYTFTIVLPNGSEYPSEIKTPIANFQTISIPENINPSSNLTISWSPNYPNELVHISFTATNKNDGSIFIYSREVNDLGQITINNAELNYPTQSEFKYGSATITLRRENKGVVNTAFKDGSITATTSYIRNANIQY